MKLAVFRFEIRGAWTIKTCENLKQALETIKSAMFYIGDGPEIEVVVHCDPTPEPEPEPKKRK